MEIDHLNNENERFNQETDVSLEESKIQIPSPGPDSSSPEHSNDAKLERKKNAREKIVRKKSNGSQSLVLQMFSHLKTQKQFEEEKNSKIALSDRRRQKIKRELAASCPPVVSPLKTFGSSWTQFRMLRGPQSKLQETQTGAQDKDVPDPPNAESTHEPNVWVSHSDSLRVNNGHDVATFESNSQADREQSNGTARETDFLKHPQRLQYKQPPDSSLYRPTPPQDHKGPHFGSPKDQNYQHRSGGTLAAYNASKTHSHILKGPGKIQIRFSTCSAPSSRQTQRGHKHNYQWDTMPAGTLASVQPSLITFDGSIL
ncbi:hypothetical protein ElyMa_001450600 [Elysia marginata]|uniref:Uncharacterized protein n=1 Tax=Elysia marginata TaxID=1093978 RepID=A0AAV4IZN8_9GAST|nr:hypothetical protein ElyMa_001450600 [Elysia marginata]